MSEQLKILVITGADGESNRAKASKEAHQAPKQFVSDVSVSSLHHIYSQLGDGFLLVFADA